MEKSHRTYVNDELTHLGVESIARLAEQRGTDELWLCDAGVKSWRDFGDAVETARKKCVDAGVAPGSVVVSPADDGFESLSWLFGAAAAQAVVSPLRRVRYGEIHAWKKIVEIGWRVRDSGLARVGKGTMSPAAESLLGELRSRDHPGLILATGGTTGRPKLVLHDLSVLLLTVPVRTAWAKRVLPLMRFDHIGGLDVAWRVLAGGQVLVAPPAELTPEAVGATIERFRVEVMPATPSFLNLLLLAEIHRSRDLSSLNVVPYGAEPMPATLLSRLRAALPQVEFVQRFGTSETGSLPVASVGGNLWLRDNQAGFAWKIVEGELWVRSPARALGYLSGISGGFDADGWFRTGDLAEVAADGTVRVLGRQEELINIGGEKVLPAEVEEALLAHPFVADCRVHAQANAVLGQVVAAEVVWRGTTRDAVAVKRMLREFAIRRLARHKLPVVVRLVVSLRASGNFKKLRGGKW